MRSRSRGGTRASRGGPPTRPRQCRATLDPCLAAPRRAFDDVDPFRGGAWARNAAGFVTVHRPPWRNARARTRPPSRRAMVARTSRRRSRLTIRRLDVLKATLELLARRRRAQEPRPEAAERPARGDHATTERLGSRPDTPVHVEVSAGTSDHPIPEPERTEHGLMRREHREVTPSGRATRAPSGRRPSPEPHPIRLPAKATPNARTPPPHLGADVRRRAERQDDDCTPETTNCRGRSADAVSIARTIEATSDGRGERAARASDGRRSSSTRSVDHAAESAGASSSRAAR